jgi:hypothetical protein
MNYDILYTSTNEEITMSHLNIINTLEADVVAAYKKLFPLSTIYFSKGALGCSFITLMLTDKDTVFNGIIQNDQFFTTIMIEQNADGTFTMENCNGSLSINPIEKFYAMSHVKCAIRRTTGDANKIKKTLATYFKKRKDVIDANKSNIYGASKITKFLE